MSKTSLAINLGFTSRELFDAAEAPFAANEEQRTLRAAQQALNKTFNDTTTPALSGPPISRVITLGAGITTIDLTAAAVLAMPGAATRTYDFTGKKVVAFAIRTKETNAGGGVTIAPGAADPYPLFGAGKSIILTPDSELVRTFRTLASNLPAVAGAVKNIDLSGTNLDVVYLDMVFGT